MACSVGEKSSTLRSAGAGKSARGPGRSWVAVRRLLSRIGAEAAVQLCRLQDNDAAQVVVERVLARGDCYTIGDLCVGGDDLMAMGFRGQGIGEGLRVVLDRVIEGELVNDREAVVGFLRDLAP